MSPTVPLLTVPNLIVIGPVKGVRITGEAAPQFRTSPGSPRCRDELPSIYTDARILYLVRDPIRRIVPHFRHRYETDEINRHLLTSDLESSVYLAASRYATQIQRYLNLFRANRSSWWS